MLWRLQFEDGTHFDLPLGTSLVGRGDGCAIRVPHPSVSREHLRLEVLDDQVRLEDLGSRNGTWLARARLRAPAIARAAVELRVGDVELVLSSVEGAYAPSAARLRVRCLRCDAQLEGGRCVRCVADATLRGRVVERDDGPSSETPAQLVERSRWFVDLHVELVQRALATGNLAEAEGALRRLVDEPESLAGPTPTRSERVLRCALSLAVARGDARWLRWVFERLATSPEPPDAVVRAIELLPQSLLAQVLPAFERLLEVLEGRAVHLSPSVRDSLPPLASLAERTRGLPPPTASA